MGRTLYGLAILLTGINLKSPTHPKPSFPNGGANDGDDVASASLPGTSQPPKTRRMLVWLFHGVVALVVGTFVFITIRRSIAELANHHGTIDLGSTHYGILFLGFMISLVGMLPAGIGWLGSLRAMGQSVATIPAFYAYYLGHLGKYVPGKAMVLVLRVGKLYPLGVEIKPTIVSIFVETITSMCAGALIGCAMLLLLSPPGWMMIGAGCGIPCALGLLLPYPFRFALGLLARSRIGRMPKSVHQAICGSLMLRTSLWMALGWLLNGTGAWLLLNGLASEQSSWTLLAWMACVSAVSLGGVAGFVSMIPGGALVRELVITWLLALVVPEPIALVAAIVFRLASLTGEAVLALSLKLLATRF